MATQAIEQQLLEGAELGSLPFDVFALEKWDYTRPVAQDQEQWNTIAHEWLSLDARGRHPYHSRTAKDTPTAQLQRVLAPHQTARERNLSLRTAMGRYAPVWLRTCYAADLSDTYATAVGPAPALEEILGHWSQILDDETLYNGDWMKVLLRVPAIADTVRYEYETDASLRDPSEDLEAPEDDYERRGPLYEAAVRERTMLYLVDEEALRVGMVKVLWLDVHGVCVWENRVRLEQLLQFKGRLFDGGSLGMFFDEWDGIEHMYVRGAVIDVD